MYSIILGLFLVFLWLQLNGTNEGFEGSYKNDIPIYYINLDRSVSRKNTLLKQFEKYNIKNFKRISAITPDQIKVDRKAMYKQSCPYQNEVEFACLLSHLKTIHTAYKNGDEKAFIVEDDLIIERMINFEKLFGTAPADWEILQVHVLNSEMYDVNRDLWIPYKYTYWSTAAYVINRKGMISVLSKLFTNYDNPIFEELQFNWSFIARLNSCVADSMIYTVAKTYSCNDLLFRTPTEESTIHMENLPVHELHEQEIMQFFKKHGYKNKEIGYTIE